MHLKILSQYLFITLLLLSWSSPNTVTAGGGEGLASRRGAGSHLSHCPTRGEAFLSLAPSSGHLQTPPALQILQFHFSESIIVLLYFVLENYLWGEMQRFYFSPCGQ